MVKKRAKRASKSVVDESVVSSPQHDLLVENFVGLQHAMTNLSVKFGALSDNISKLLEIFEEAAKNISQSENQLHDDITKKIDFLLDQNKTIARGLVMMEDKLRGHPSTSPALTAAPPIAAPPIQPPAQQAPPLRSPAPPQPSQGRPRPLPQL